MLHVKYDKSVEVKCPYMMNPRKHADGNEQMIIIEFIGTARFTWFLVQKNLVFYY